MLVACSDKIPVAVHVKVESLVRSCAVAFEPSYQGRVISREGLKLEGMIHAVQITRVIDQQMRTSTHGHNENVALSRMPGNLNHTLAFADMPSS